MKIRKLAHLKPSRTKNELGKTNRKEWEKEKKKEEKKKLDAKLKKWGESWPGNKALFYTPVVNEAWEYCWYLSEELKSYQELTLRLTKQLQNACTKIDSLQSENSFLKSELELFHTTNMSSTNFQEGSNTNESSGSMEMVEHYKSRLRQVEKLYSEKEDKLKNAIAQLQAKLDN